MRNYIPLSVPNLSGNELEYVTEAIKTEWVSTVGSYVEQFERDTARYVNSDEAVACQSGTSGLHLALQVLDVKKDDEVIVPTVTFIASVNPIMYIDARPIFMDCDDDLTLDLTKLERFLEEECTIINERLINKKTKRQIKAVIPVHVFGNMVNMEKLVDLSNRYHFFIIEDAAEALGTVIQEGRYRGKHAGTIGDIGVYSFNGNKIITTGGGGMLVSNNFKYLKKAKYLSTQAKDNALFFIHNEIGYNYRMTNLQAAIGVAQLEQLEGFVKIKKRNYEIYANRIESIKGLKLLPFSDKIRPNYWFYSIIVDEKEFRITRNEFVTELEKHHIQARPLWGLIHLQKPYKNMETYQIERAYYYADGLLNIPCSTNLTEQDVHYVCDVFKEISVRR